MFLKFPAQTSNKYIFCPRLFSGGKSFFPMLFALGWLMHLFCGSAAFEDFRRAVAHFAAVGARAIDQIVLASPALAY